MESRLARWLYRKPLGDDADSFKFAREPPIDRPMHVTTTSRLLSLIGCGLALIAPGCPLSKSEILESLSARCVSGSEALPTGAWV